MVIRAIKYKITGWTFGGGWSLTEKTLSFSLSAFGFTFTLFSHMCHIWGHDAVKYLLHLLDMNRQDVEQRRRKLKQS